MRTAKQISAMTEDEADDYACDLSNQMGFLEHGYKDWNGNWIDARAKREHKHLESLAAAVDARIDQLTAGGK